MPPLGLPLALPGGGVIVALPPAVTGVAAEPLLGLTSMPSERGTPAAGAAGRFGHSTVGGNSRGPRMLARWRGGIQPAGGCARPRVSPNGPPRKASTISVKPLPQKNWAMETQSASQLVLQHASLYAHTVWQQPASSQNGVACTWKQLPVPEPPQVGPSHPQRGSLAADWTQALSHADSQQNVSLSQILVNQTS